jgi:3-oxoacyl-(acyl-carrier-protein) synthase
MTVVVTGLALRTALGSSPTELVQRLLAGECAAQPNTRFPSDTYPCSLSAPIAAAPPHSPHSRVLGRMGLFALAVGSEALADVECASASKLGLFSAMGGLRANWGELMPALSGQASDFSDSWRRGFKNLHPFWMLQHLSNNAHALLAQEIAARGDGVTFSGSNAGVQALAAAARALEVHAVDAALVVAYDSLIEPETIVELGARGALSSRAVEDLAAPYDVAASGLVPGEAAAALVLERSEGAAERAFCEVSSADAADGSTTEPDVATVIRCAARVARHERVVDGCSLSQVAFDRAELDALDGVLSGPLRLISVRGSTGSLGAASSLVQVIALAGLLGEGRLAPIAGLRRAIGAGPVVAEEPTAETSALALSAGAPGLAGAVRVSIARAARRVT